MHTTEISTEATKGTLLDREEWVYTRQTKILVRRIQQQLRIFESELSRQTRKLYGTIEKAEINFFFKVTTVIRY